MGERFAPALVCLNHFQTGVGDEAPQQRQGHELTTNRTEPSIVSSSV